MTFKFFKIDFKRSLKHNLALVTLCLVLGLVITSSFFFKKQMTELYKPVDWGVDLLVLPKGINPEAAQKNIVNGEPSALLPEALFESLQSQVIDEQKRKNMTDPSLQMAGLIPYKNSENRIKLAVIGNTKNIFNNNEQSFLSAYKKTDLLQTQSQFSFLPNYQTPEWKDKVIFMILVKGSSEAIQSLKNLVDRRTVAESFLVNSDGTSEQSLKYGKLVSMLNYLTVFFILVLGIGLYLALQSLIEARKNIFINFKELSMPQSYNWQFIFYQNLFLIFIPLLVGCLLALQLSEFLQTLI